MLTATIAQIDDIGTKGLRRVVAVLEDPAIGFAEKYQLDVESVDALRAMLQRLSVKAIDGEASLKTLVVGPFDLGFASTTPPDPERVAFAVLVGQYRRAVRLVAEGIVIPDDPAALLKSVNDAIAKNPVLADAL